MTILANNLTCADHLSAIQTTGEYTLDTEINDMQPGIYFATISLKNSSEEFLKTIRLVKGK